MGANLKQGDPFISIIFGRDPMDRLVSCWRDKIWRREGKRWMYRGDTIRMLRYMGRTDCPDGIKETDQATAWDKGRFPVFFIFVHNLMAQLFFRLSSSI